MSIVLSVMIAVIIVGVIDFIMWKLTQNANREQVKKVIILFLGVMFLEIIIINVIKIPWGRPRMRMITAQNQVFQPWWVIGSSMKDHLMSLGIAAEEFKSFPSGHSANAACAMMLGVLPCYLSKTKGKRKLIIFYWNHVDFNSCFFKNYYGCTFFNRCYCWDECYISY